MSETTDPQTLAAEALLPHRFHGTKCSCREAEYNGDYAQRKEQHAAHLGAVLSGAGLLAEHRVSGLATWRELCEKAEDERDAARAELAEVKAQLRAALDAAERIRNTWIARKRIADETADVVSAKVSELVYQCEHLKVRAEKAEAEQHQLFRALPYDWRKQYERAENAERKYADLVVEILSLATKWKEEILSDDLDFDLYAVPEILQSLVNGENRD